MNKILLGLVVLVIVIFAGMFGVREWFGASAWHVVYLRTGDLYFGKLTRFPHFGLTQVYMLQVNSGNAQSPLSIQQFKKVVWGPQDWVRINKQEVVWETELDSTGQLAEILSKNPDLKATEITPPVSTAPVPPNGGGQDIPSSAKDSGR